jgi:chromosome segregation ATPase
LREKENMRLMALLDKQKREADELRSDLDITKRLLNKAKMEVRQNDRLLMQQQTQSAASLHSVAAAFQAAGQRGSPSRAEDDSSVGGDKESTSKSRNNKLRASLPAVIANAWQHQYDDNKKATHKAPPSSEQELDPETADRHSAPVDAATHRRLEQELAQRERDLAKLQAALEKTVGALAAEKLSAEKATKDLQAQRLAHDKADRSAALENTKKSAAHAKIAGEKAQLEKEVARLQGQLDRQVAASHGAQDNAKKSDHDVVAREKELQRLAALLEKANTAAAASQSAADKAQKELLALKASSAASEKASAEEHAKRQAADKKAAMERANLEKEVARLAALVESQGQAAGVEKKLGTELAARERELAKLHAKIETLTAQTAADRLALDKASKDALHAKSVQDKADRAAAEEAAKKALQDKRLGVERMQLEREVARLQATLDATGQQGGAEKKLMAELGSKERELDRAKALLEKHEASTTKRLGELQAQKEQEGLKWQQTIEKQKVEIEQLRDELAELKRGHNKSKSVHAAGDADLAAAASGADASDTPAAAAAPALSPSHKSTPSSGECISTAEATAQLQKVEKLHLGVVKKLETSVTNKDREIAKLQQALDKLTQKSREDQVALAKATREVAAATSTGSGGSAAGSGASAKKLEHDLQAKEREVAKLAVQLDKLSTQATADRVALDKANKDLQAAKAAAHAVERAAADEANKRAQVDKKLAAERAALERDVARLQTAVGAQGQAVDSEKKLSHELGSKERELERVKALLDRQQVASEERLAKMQAQRDVDFEKLHAQLDKHKLEADELRAELDSFKRMLNKAAGAAATPSMSAAAAPAPAAAAGSAAVPIPSPSKPARAPPVEPSGAGPAEKPIVLQQLTAADRLKARRLKEQQEKAAAAAAAAAASGATPATGNVSDREEKQNDGPTPSSSPAPLRTASPAPVPVAAAPATTASPAPPAADKDKEFAAAAANAADEAAVDAQM